MGGEEGVIKTRDRAAAFTVAGSRRTSKRTCLETGARHPCRGAASPRRRAPSLPPTTAPSGHRYLGASARRPCRAAASPRRRAPSLLPITAPSDRRYLWTLARRPSQAAALL